MTTHPQAHSFLTVAYRSGYIHSHCYGDQEIVRAQLPNGGTTGPLCSRQAAKLAITRAEKKFPLMSR